VRAQFFDGFDDAAASLKAWGSGVGDGNLQMFLVFEGDGILRVRVDARADRRNIWWALLKRNVAPSLDLAALARPGTELRLEARVRTASAPKRINLHVNTQRTTDFHSHLREFYIAEPNRWTTVSFTTDGFPAGPGDEVNAQLALMDWGIGEHALEIDYYRVDVVERPGPDAGEPLRYHPEVGDLSRFREALIARADAVVDRAEPDRVLHDWSALEEGKATPILGVNGTLLSVLRFDTSAVRGRRAAGEGVLELTTHSVQRRAEPVKDFGGVRVVEILGGDPEWEEASVSYERLTQGRAYEAVFNTQMIMDVEVTATADGLTHAVLPRPVLQRLLDGRTKGLALLPLGSVNAAFFARENGAERAPKLRFTLE
jgi:hypothetical protein